jgi:hypothetical protein
VNVNHIIIAKISEEKVNNPLRKVERPTCKKRSNPSGNVMSIFLLPKILSKKIIWNKNYFWRIWAYRLLKIICPCNLFKVYG